MTTYLAAYEYDDGTGFGGAGPLGLYTDPAKAVADALDYFVTESPDYVDEDGDEDGWLRVDVWSVEDAADEDAAWDMWRDEELTDDGDVLHIDTGMYHD